MNISIRIGASLSADPGEIVYQSLLRGTKRARAAMAKEMGAIGADQVKTARGAADASAKAQIAIDKKAASQRLDAEKAVLAHRMAMDRQVLAAHLQRSRDAHRQELALAKDIATKKSTYETDTSREAIRAHERAIRERQKAERRAASEAKRRQSELDREIRREQFSNERGGRRIAGDAVRSVGGLARRGIGIAADIARGAGVDFSLQTGVARHVGLEKQATDLSNSGYQAGDARNGTRVDPRELMGDARRIGMATATDAGKVVGGLQSFVGLSGDLATGREIMGELAKLSRATGSELEDMAAAAGNLGQQLDGVPNKAERIKEIMRAVAGQGKLGAVEIKDLAAQMAKVATSGTQFGTDKTSAIIDMGVLTQMARQRGGASSATQAATYQKSFANTFSKAARRKEFAAAGVEVEDGKGNLRSVEEIIVESLRATKGDTRKMGKLFMDAGARSVTRGWESVYRDAGGGEKGEAAVRSEFSRMRKASMGEGEVADSFAKSMQTAEAKAQLFQQRLDIVVAGLADKVIPALNKLGPSAEMAAAGFGKVAAISAEHPVLAITGAIVAMIGKAALGELITKTIAERLASNMGALGMAGIAITAAAVTLIATKEIYDQDKKKKEIAKEGIDDLLSNTKKTEHDIAMLDAKDAKLQAEKEKEWGAEGGADVDAVAKIEEEQKKIATERGRKVEELGFYKERIGQVTAEATATKEELAAGDAAGGPTLGGAGGTVASWLNSILKTIGVDTGGPDRRDVANAEAVEARLEELKAATDRTNNLLSGTIKVTQLVPLGPPEAGAVPGARTE